MQNSKQRGYYIGGTRRLDDFSIKRCVNVFYILLFRVYINMHNLFIYFKIKINQSCFKKIITICIVLYMRISYYTLSFFLFYNFETFPTATVVVSFINDSDDAGRKMNLVLLLRSFIIIPSLLFFTHSI